MDQIVEELKNLEHICTVMCQHLKGKNGLTPKDKRERFSIQYAYQLYRALQNLLRITPGSSYFVELEDQINDFNLTSMASLTRNLWDVLIGFLFHIGDAKDDERFDYKNILQNFLLCNKRVQVLGLMTPVDKRPAGMNDLYEEQTKLLSEAKELLEDRNEFQILHKSVKKRVKGNHFSPLKDDLLSAIGICSKWYQSVHMYLSNHTHYFAYGFIQDLEFHHEPNKDHALKSVLRYAEIPCLYFLKESTHEFHPEWFIDELKPRIKVWESYFENRS